MDHRLIALGLACLLLGGCAGTPLPQSPGSAATPSSASSEASSEAPSEASSEASETSSPLYDLPIRGFGLNGIGLILALPEGTVTDPNRPELPQEVLCNLTPGGLLAWRWEGYDAFNGGYSALGIALNQDTFLTEKGIERKKLGPDRPIHHWFYNQDRCYFLDDSARTIVVVLQGFYRTDLERPGAIIKLGDHLFSPADLEEQMVFENETYRVFAFTEIQSQEAGGTANFPQNFRALVQDRINRDPYFSDLNYTDPDYDYTWALEAVDTLLAHIGDYIAPDPAAPAT